MTKGKKEVEKGECLEKNDFVIDWTSAMDDDGDGDGKEDKVPELVIVNTKPQPFLSDDQNDSQKSLTDRALEEQLVRIKSHLVTLGPGLPDKGEKIRLKIACLEEEKQRRVLLRSKMDAEGSSKLMQPTSSVSDVSAQGNVASRDTSREENTASKDISRQENAASKDTCKQGDTASKDISRQKNAASKDTSGQGDTASKDTSRQENAASKDTSKQGNTDTKEVSRATFASFFSKPKTDTQPTKAFGKELEDLGCGSKKQKATKKTVTRLNNGWRLLPDIGKAEHSEKKLNSGLKGSKGNQKSEESFGNKKRKLSSTYSLLDDDDIDSNGHGTPREWSWEEVPSQSSKRCKKSDDSVINVDEEESQPSTEAEQAVELPEGLQEDICYPSRDDPHFVQVCLKDLECLAPREFLTSPIMNFFIRFLQQQVSASNQISADCHFFNTYFYKKLSDAVTYKGNDKEAFFVKFRRWWKGIDLFRKAYIFIPIHEDLHWSLVIVCIPDKEDESGLTILHLDSLRLHSRKSIVENVKRFLKDEWNYLKQDDCYSDIPISEKIWRNLPRRISEADVQVPQQKNDFDCGTFVLFFIKRFIEEAPQRLKRKDLGMFDKKWFRPAEASALRIKIRNILIDLFSNKTDCQNDQNDQTDQTSIKQKTPVDAAASKSRHYSFRV